MKLILALLFIASCATKPIETVPVNTPVSSEPVEIIVAKNEPFSFKSSLPYIAEVARVSNCVINNEAFLKEVESFPKYTFTDLSPAQVGKILRNFKPVTISTYKYWSSKVIATTYAKDRTTLYFNTKANPRKMPAMINTAFHEGLHLNGTSHGDNSSKGKEDSVNYRVGDISEKYVPGCM